MSHDDNYLTVGQKPATASFTVSTAPKNYDRADDVGTTDLSFGDFIDVINPLQHIPLVSTAYRAITGDTISGTARVLGGALYGGPLGAVTAFASGVAAETTGKDAGQHMLAMVMGEGAAGASATTQLAQAPPAESPVQAAQAPVAPVLVTHAAPAATAIPGTPSSRPFANLAATPVAARGPAPMAEPAVARAAPDSAAAVAPGAIPKEMIADVMMRNLQKYEQSARSGERMASHVRVSS